MLINYFPNFPMYYPWPVFWPMPFYLMNTPQVETEAEYVDDLEIPEFLDDC